MKRMRIMGLSLVAVFALAAVFAGSASAKTQVLTLKTSSGPLAPGDEINAESSDLMFITTSGVTLNARATSSTGTVDQQRREGHGQRQRRVLHR